MFYRILTKNGVDNTNIDGARNYNFNAGRRSGIVQGALNSGNLFLSANNTIALDTCELRLCGHRVVIDSAEYKTFYNQPSVPIRYSLVAQIIVSNNGESVSFDLKTQLSTTPLVQNDLDKNINGTYELEIGRFTQLTDGTLTDVVRTADLITGGGNNDSEYIRIGTVTTNKISPELDADVDIENTINPDDNKPQTNFTFNLPTSVGTVVSVNGEEKTSINTDTTPTANSQNLVTSGGVHDYPAVTFAESERQKSQTDGAIVHEKEIADVEHIETIYDMSSSDSNINWGYTGGILLFNELTITHDFSGFKKYDFIYEPNTHSENWYGSARTITVYDAIAGDGVFTYFDCVSPSNCYAQNVGGMEIYTALRMASNKQSVTVMSYKINADGSFSVINSGDNNFYRLIKIVGYK